MKTKLIIFTTAILGLFSCVDIIDLDIDSSKSRPVIEAYINDKGFATASVTLSAAYDDVLDFSQLDAIITLSNSNGESEVLELIDTLNIYQGSVIKGKPNETYLLNFQIDTSVFDVESSISSPISIDSINCEYNLEMSKLIQKFPQEEESDEPFYDSLYDISVYYTDIVDEENYYLVRLAHNGDINIDYRNLSDDKDTDGESRYSLFMEGLAITDTVTIHLYSLDKGGYTYYEGLNDLGNSDIPYNPYTNIVGTTDVLGFFSARFVTQETFIVRDIATFEESEEAALSK